MNKFPIINGNKFGYVNRSCPIHKANEVIRMKCTKQGGQDHKFCCNAYNPYHRDPVPNDPVCESRELKCETFDEHVDNGVAEALQGKDDVKCETPIDISVDETVDEAPTEPTTEPLDADLKLYDIYAPAEESFVMEKKDIVVAHQGMKVVSYKDLVKKQVRTW